MALIIAIFICVIFYWIRPSLEQQEKLALIDLHRAGIRRVVPERWIIKDLAGLYFSCQHIGLTQRDKLRFMRHYRQQSLRTIMETEHQFWEKVSIRGNTYRDHTK